MSISIENLTKVYGKQRALDSLSFEVAKGEVLGFLGPNGAGKTTTFYMIVGLLKANSGQVLLDEQDLTRVPMYRRARAGIGYLSQEPSIFRRLTVEQNVMAILETLDLSRKQREHRLDELLEEIRWAKNELGADRVRKVFLADGDALVAKASFLGKLLDACHEAFPNLRRISCYASPQSLQIRSVEEMN